MVQETPLFPGTIARPALTLSCTPRYIPAVPTPDALRARVERALATVRNPRLERDVLSAGLVADLVVDDAGRVSFTFQLARDDPGSLAREVRKAVQAVEGVSAVKVNVAAASGPAPARPAPGAVPPPPTPIAQPNLGAILAISSGKGGLGKSTVAA